MLADGVGHRRQSQSKCLWALLSLQMVLRRGAAVLGATAGHQDSVGAGEVERSSWLQSRQHGARLSCALLARACAAERAPVPLRQVPLRHLRRVPRIKLTACSLPCVWSRRATIVPSYFGPALCASLSKWQRSSSSCASTMLSEYGLTKTHSSKLLSGLADYKLARGKQRVSASGQDAILKEPPKGQAQAGSTTLGACASGTS